MSNLKNSPLSIIGQSNESPRLTFDINTAKNIECENCDGDIFEQGLIFRKIPKLAVGAKEDRYVTLPVFICKACGEVQQELSDFNHSA